MKHLVACLCLLFGCTTSGGVDSLVGLTCKSADECDPSGVCVTTQSDGACALECQSPGGVGECPRGTYCDRFEATIDTDEVEHVRTLCMPSCERQEDCRDGYSCSGVSGGPGKVCLPDKSDS